MRGIAGTKRRDRARSTTNQTRKTTGAGVQTPRNTSMTGKRKTDIDRPGPHTNTATGTFQSLTTIEDTRDPRRNQTATLTGAESGTDQARRNTMILTRARVTITGDAPASENHLPTMLKHDLA